MLSGRFIVLAAPADLILPATNNLFNSFGVAKFCPFAYPPAVPGTVLFMPDTVLIAMILRTRFLLLLSIILFTGFLAKGQSPAHLPGQLLVSLLPGTKVENLARRGSTDLGVPFFVQKKVSNLLNIWQLQTASEESTEQAALDWLRHQPEVRIAQFNHWLENRGGPENSVLPNDPLVGEQWQYVNNGAGGGLFDADLDADQAWDFTTGGLSALGDTLVVAVIDGGADFQHPDLAANAWHNWADIPNDGLDNDQNGFTDDFRGWNVDAQNDDITGQTTGHGTPICGLLGARGDNGIGVAGVNWRVKIMFVASSGSEASILAAYDYIWAARCLYNSTNGQQGAFVTAINCSWGINYGQPVDAPLWCAAFDTLGAAGILSVAATANLAVDVDLTGDLPTACPSDYLIAVTSLQRNDEKALLAGWGAKNIDLGAYGQNVFTLGEGNTYGQFSGTSYAAPQVTGAIALLYSMPNANLIALAKNDPAAAARWVKELLLTTTTPNLSLVGLTSTGGRLNLFNLLNHYNNVSNACPAVSALTAESQDSSMVVSWSQVVDYQKFNLQYRLADQSEWIVKTDVMSPVVLPLPGYCQGYEFFLQGYCPTGQTTAWAVPAQLTIPGCCAPSSTIILQEATTHSLAITWDGSNSWSNGVLRYRVAGSSNWLTVATTSNMATINDLQPCTSYEVQVYGQCDNLLSPFSSMFQFATSCEPCNGLNYCAANAGQSSGEWIADVTIGDWSNTSGIGGGGYQNFTGEQSTMLELHPLTAPSVAVTPGFYGTPAKEYFRIYIDFNADGDFTDAGELAFDPGYAHNNTMFGHLQIPVFTQAGYTRMRILMKAKNATNQPPLPCESFDFGQIEDYCVLLSPTDASPQPLAETAGKLRISPQPAQTTVRLEWPADGAKNVRLRIWNMADQLVLSQSMENLSASMLDVSTWNPGIYLVSIQTERGRWQGRLIVLK